MSRGKLGLGPTFSGERTVIYFTKLASRSTALVQCSMCVNDLFQFSTVAVYALSNTFSCRRKKTISSTV